MIISSDFLEDVNKSKVIEDFIHNKKKKENIKGTSCRWVTTLGTLIQCYYCTYNTRVHLNEPKYDENKFQK